MAGTGDPWAWMKFRPSLSIPITTRVKDKSLSDKEALDEERKRRDEALQSALAHGDAGDIKGMLRKLAEAGETPIMQPSEAATKKGALFIDGPAYVDKEGKTQQGGAQVMSAGKGGLDPAQVANGPATMQMLQKRFLEQSGAQALASTETRDVEGPGGKRQTVISNAMGIGERRFDQAPKPADEGDLRKIEQDDRVITQEYRRQKGGGFGWTNIGEGARWSPNERNAASKAAESKRKEQEHLDALREKALKAYQDQWSDPVGGELKQSAPDKDEFIDTYVRQATGGRLSPKTSHAKDNLLDTVDTSDWTDDDMKVYHDTLLKARDTKKVKYDDAVRAGVEAVRKARELRKQQVGNAVQYTTPAGAWAAGIGY